MTGDEHGGSGDAALASRPDRLHDLLGEIAASQRELERSVAVVDAGSPVDLVSFVAAQSRLSTAVAAWNLRSDGAEHRAAGRGRWTVRAAPPGTASSDR